MKGDVSFTVKELTEKAEEYLYERSLSPAEYEALKHSVAELAQIFSHDTAYFILGSYGQPEITRLRLVKDRINRNGNAYAFLMIDIRSEWTNTYLKFRILADYTDYIIGVAEHNQGGFLVEQGYFTILEGYFVKTHVFKREYDTLDPEEVDTGVNLETPYSAMQTDVFGMLKEAGRLCVWMTEGELADCADAVI